jgi:predicted kinase
MTPIVIPDPSLVLLVGAAGSGKSSLAARLFATDEIVSSDALRSAVSGDEADQAASRLAFRIRHRTVDRRTGNGLLTVVDATNAIAAHRAPLIRRAIAAGVPLVAIVLDLASARVHAQNAGRARVVDAEIVDRQLAGIRATVDRRQLEAAGFALVIRLDSPEEAAALMIRRRVTRPPGAPARSADESAEGAEGAGGAGGAGGAD